MLHIVDVASRSNRSGDNPVPVTDWDPIRWPNTWSPPLPTMPSCRICTVDASGVWWTRMLVGSSRAVCASRRRARGGGGGNSRGVSSRAPARGVESTGIVALSSWFRRASRRCVLSSSRGLVPCLLASGRLFSPLRRWQLLARPNVSVGVRVSGATSGKSAAAVSWRLPHASAAHRRARPGPPRRHSPGSRWWTIHSLPAGRCCNVSALAMDMRRCEECTGTRTTLHAPSALRVTHRAVHSLCPPPSSLLTSQVAA